MKHDRDCLGVALGPAYCSTTNVDRRIRLQAQASATKSTAPIHARSASRDVQRRNHSASRWLPDRARSRST
jgi:hypothetical protein